MPRRCFVYRYLLTFEDGHTERYQRLADLQQRFGISKWTAEQISKDSDKCEARTGATMTRTHCNSQGDPLPVLHRDPRYRCNPQ